MSRRLLDLPALCEKLGYSRSTFQRRRADLEAAGFPPPCLEADQFGSTRWDDRAIDLWLDGRMPGHLRAKAAPANRVDLDAIQSRLRDRAREVHL